MTSEVQTYSPYPARATSYPAHINPDRYDKVTAWAQAMIGTKDLDYPIPGSFELQIGVLMPGVDGPLDGKPGQRRWATIYNNGGPHQARAYCAAINYLYRCHVERAKDISTRVSAPNQEHANTLAQYCQKMSDKHTEKTYPFIIKSLAGYGHHVEVLMYGRGKVDAAPLPHPGYGPEYCSPEAAKNFIDEKWDHHRSARIAAEHLIAALPTTDKAIPFLEAMRDTCQVSENKWNQRRT